MVGALLNDVAAWDGEEAGLQQRAQSSHVAYAALSLTLTAGTRPSPASVQP
jgi:hypothetical protein